MKLVKANNLQSAPRKHHYNSVEGKALLDEFLASDMDLAYVEDEDLKYLGQNNLRKCFKLLVEKHELPVEVFMIDGYTYLRKVENGSN